MNLEDKSIKIIQSEEQKEKIKNNILSNLWDNIKSSLTYTIHLDSQKRENGEENDTGRILEDTSKTRNGK